jgi:hypothetical protein
MAATGAGDDRNLAVEADVSHEDVPLRNGESGVAP